MRLIRYCVPFLLVFALFATLSTTASAQSKNLPDSLRSVSAALAEGSLQHLLDSLGYSIDVANDELGIETFCAPGGLNTATMVLEVAGSAVSAKSGYYNAANHTQRYQLFGPTAVPGTTVTFTVASGISDIGFYMQPNLDGSYYWYSETSLNFDGDDHVWVFSTGVPREYILAFEDLEDAGDADYQDLVIKVIFDYDPPTLSGCPTNVTVECDNVPAAATVTASADCGPSPTVTMTETTTPGSCPNAYTITRTWTATDQWGGTASCSQVITVVDTTPPTLAGCPTNVTVQCDAVPAAATVTATDNCDASVSVSMTATTTPGSCDQSYTLTRTWTATDDCGNIASCSQVITVVDNVAPVLAGCPTDVTVEYGSVPVAATVTATDNCDASVSVTMTVTNTPGSCAHEYTLTRTWTATDDCGNSASCSQVITVVDTTPPVIAGCPANATVECDAVPIPATVTASDAGGGSVTLNYNETTTPGSCPDAYTLTRTWTATDDCGNTATCSQVITVVDTTPPTLAGCPSNVTVECDAVPAAATVTATDNCDASVSVTMTETTTPGSCEGSYTLTRTWTATDDCGNTATCSQVITVVDTTPPTLAGCPSNVTVECDAIPAAVTVTATDDCDASVSVTMTETTTPGSCDQSYSLARTWTATDDCGNTATCSQVITVVDTTPPTIACPGPISVQCMADVPAPNTGAVTVSDNCDPSPVVTFEGEVPDGGACPKTITRTYKAIDACGNYAMCTQTITVNDDTPPVLAGCPSDITVEYGSVPSPATVTATDNCSPTLTVVFNETTTPGPSPHEYTLTRTWTATDDCGNSTSCTQVITVVDTTPPLLTGCPPIDLTVECDAIPLPPTITAEDFGGGAVTVTYNETTTPGSCDQSYTLTRTWTATDGSGNSVTCTHIINVVDTTPPTITCPAPVSVQCMADVPAPNTAAVIVVDNCDPSPVVTFEGDVPDGATCPKIITRTYKAIDDCGNYALCTQTITVNDDTPPVLAGCPSDVAIECDQALPPVATVTATDNCDSSPTVTMNETTTPGACAASYVVTRTWTATDDCGNTATCSQNITLSDNTPPVLACPADITVSFMTDVPAPDLGAVVATDNCDGSPSLLFVSDVYDGNTCPGTIVRTYRATDDCGNYAYCQQTITVLYIDDTEPPVLSGCPSDAAISCDQPIPAAPTVTATDGCDPDVAVVFTETTTPGSCPNAYTITRTWSATDDSGNNATCTQVITVVDNEAPVLSGCPANETVPCDAIPAPVTVTATDNCDVSVTVGFAETTTPGGCANEYVITRTWTAADDCGNVVSCTQTINVVDDVAPVLTGCPANVEIACDDALPTPAAVTATDNCGSVTLDYEQTEAQGSCPQETIYTRTWTATDACGNSASCSQTITARDLVDPVCVLPADNDFDLCAPGQICLPVSATDNCDPAPVCTVLAGPGTITDGQWCYTPTASGSWDVTVRCTDGCGNFCEGTFHVTATVNRPPTLTNCPAADFTAQWGETFIYDFNASDPDAGQTLTFALCNDAPSGLTINAASGVVSWTTHAIDICDGDLCVMVSDPCGLADTCEVHVNVVNDPPEIACIDDQSICYGYEFSSQVTATDPDHGPYGPWFFLQSGPAGLTVNPNSGAIDWPEPTPGDHEICIIATDSAHICDYSPANADTCCFNLKVVALDVVIEKIHNQIQGQYTNVSVDFKYTDVNWPIGGYDFLIQYDPTALCFIKATAGEFLGDCAWEYFTYRFGPSGMCGNSACPDGILRITALAETNGGNVANHPDCYTNDGVASPGPGSSDSTQLALLNFLVSNDRAYQCQFVPIRFVWYDCGDNGLSSVYGDTLHISNQVFDYGGEPADDYWMPVTGLDNTMPTVTGAPSPECDLSFKYEVIRCANFYNGGVDLICADSIDAPGDINLNGISYEVADAVMFTNYFVSGSMAFGTHYDGSVAASDCNLDGMPLTVADLVYEIRVIIGDAVPYNKSMPITGSYSVVGDALSVADGLQISGAAITVAGMIEPELVADGMDMQYRYDGENTLIVITSRLDRSTVQSFTGEFLRNVTGEVISMEMATRDGVTVAMKTVPSTYTLKQNFPNPFNPTTTIEFSLPHAGPYELTIINIQGQVVDTYLGTADGPGTIHYDWNAGDRASGIYFYRLTTDDFTATRKMLLLK